MEQMKTALVLGATGGIGGEVARAMARRGWRVLALCRNRATAPAQGGVAWIEGDAMNGAQVLAAAQGVAVIVHAVNPPGYRDWDKLVLPMIDNTIAAARAVGARILLPGTLYNYGSGTAQPLTEASLQQPSSRKGAIRVHMEERLREAARSGVRALVVRAGDFFGPRAGNNWFSQGLVTPGADLARVTYPGAPGVGHAWAYLPDLADTMVRLLEHEARLDTFESVHFRGHWDSDGTRMVDALRRVSGNPDLKLKRLPWALLALAAPFVAVFREMREVRYLWSEAFELDNAKLVRLLGSETHTPLEAAVRATLLGLGCLPEGAARAQAA
ncbi:MAG TPA: NAD-dependent epimerase/dehydratase family protein [Telluria sp.]|jgi:nucleoside-diphosphate-sugar epimerase